MGFRYQMRKKCKQTRDKSVLSILSVRQSRNNGADQLLFSRFVQIRCVSFGPALPDNCASGRCPLNRTGKAMMIMMKTLKGRMIKRRLNVLCSIDCCCLINTLALTVLPTFGSKEVVTQTKVKIPRPFCVECFISTNKKLLWSKLMCNI